MVPAIGKSDPRTSHAANLSLTLNHLHNTNLKQMSSFAYLTYLLWSRKFPFMNSGKDCCEYKAALFCSDSSGYLRNIPSKSATIIIESGSTVYPYEIIRQA
jgi:hypothetical protein